ncbi:hypothetical protein [uncultured Clostridium sp.]|jgi:hypothetical protein|uniref:hypothetical protein n=1 Tax=uncultured Clostridium sp. TaxID=59620 RepID=UPI00261E4A61|nr:hypothetical protein [uncultured Clostridium sp.]
MKKINSLEVYLKDYNIINDKEYTKEKFITLALNEVKDRNSKLNNLLSKFIDENNLEGLEQLGTLLITNGMKFEFDVQKQNLNSENLDILKTYIKYSDDSTCSNKGAIIKVLVKADDLDGINILLNNNFITSRNVDKYLNFAINSGKYNIVPKLIERKNSWKTKDDSNGIRI